MTTALRPGQPAPDFTLLGLVLTGHTTIRHGTYRLADHRGRPLVLAFHPGDNTSTCIRQLCSYSNGLDQLTDLGADVWAISPQNLDSHEVFARRDALRMPLLCDPARTAIASYGVGRPGVGRRGIGLPGVGRRGLGMRRSVFLLDADGVIVWRHVALLGLTYPSVANLTARLAALNAAR